MYKIVTNTNAASKHTGSNPKLYFQSVIMYEVYRDDVLLATEAVEPSSWRTAHATAAKAAQRKYKIPLTAEHIKIGTDFIQ